MKKVTGTFFHLVFCLIIVALGICSTVAQKSYVIWSNAHYALPLLLTVYFLYSLWLAFIPDWAYGPKGIEIYRFAGIYPKQYSWTDVTETYIVTSPKGGFASWVIKLNDKSRIEIGGSKTRNCSKVVEDVTRFIQIENPSVEIPESVSEILKGRL